jgi:hypothetical protein
MCAPGVVMFAEAAGADSAAVEGVGAVVGRGRVSTTGCGAGAVVAAAVSARAAVDGALGVAVVTGAEGVAGALGRAVITRAEVASSIGASDCTLAQPASNSPIEKLTSRARLVGLVID